MNLDHLEAIHAARDLGLRLQPADVGAARRLGPPALHRSALRAVGPRGGGHPGRPRGPELRRRGLRGLHRRGEPGDAGQAARRVRHRRSLRAPAPVRRDRRRGRGQAEGRAAQRHDPDLLRGGDDRRAGHRAHPGAPGRSGERGPRRDCPPRRWRAWSSPTSRCGPSGRARRPRPRTPRTPVPGSGGWSAQWPRRRPTGRSASSTGDR